jgi:K+-sensing histidine kinase KdpD
VGPAALSIVLSILCFVYFFSPPIYSFAFSAADLPAGLILVFFGVLIASFSAVRRRTEGQLLQARDELQMDIEHRKRAEQARDELEEQWKAAFESNPTMYFIRSIA